MFKHSRLAVPVQGIVSAWQKLRQQIDAFKTVLLPKLVFNELFVSADPFTLCLFANCCPSTPKAFYSNSPTYIWHCRWWIVEFTDLFCVYRFWFAFL